MADTLPIGDAYRRYYPIILGKCRRILAVSAEAEDAAQETFLRLCDAGLRGDERTLLAWVYKTATRLSIDRLRARKVRQTFADDSAFASPLDHAAALAVRNMLAHLARTVPADVLECAVLCRADGMVQPDAARLLGISERTLRRRLDTFDAHARTLKAEWQ